MEELVKTAPPREGFFLSAELGVGFEPTRLTRRLTRPLQSTTMGPQHIYKAFIYNPIAKFIFYIFAENAFFIFYNYYIIIFYKNQSERKMTEKITAIFYIGAYSAPARESDSVYTALTTFCGIPLDTFTFQLPNIFNASYKY